MKKLLLPFTLLLFLFPYSGNSQINPGPPNGPWVFGYTPAAPCAGDSVYFSAVDTSSCTGPFWYWISFGDGSGWQSPGPVTSPIVIPHVYSNTGMFQVYFTIWDTAWQCTDTITTSVFVGAACPGYDVIRGLVYEDVNGNGSQDPGEMPMPYRTVSLNTGQNVTSNLNGEYGFAVPAGSYTVSVNAPSYYGVTQPATTTYSITTTGSGGIFANNDFGLHALPGIQDLGVTVWGGPPVPGFNRNYYVTYRNLGTQIMSGSVSFTFGSPMTYVTSGPAAATQSGSTVSWNFSNLVPGQAVNQTVTLNCPSSTALGTPVSHLVVINPISGDTTPLNNLDTLNQIVVGSYDPNDKIAFHDGVSTDTLIANGTRLTYKVRFQNTGTFPAQDVVVRDTLDGNLDPSSIDVLGASHFFTWRLDQNNVLTFEFMNIFLPDSNSNEPESHGHFIYSISPKPGLSDGTQILNSASIYFDFNAPIITNTQVNEIEIPVVGVVKEITGKVLVYPNPAAQNLNFRMDNAGGMGWNIELRDITGKLVQVSSETYGNLIQVERGNLPSGMYIWTVKSGNSVRSAGKVLFE